MKRIARLLGLSAVLLSIFLVAVLVSGMRLRSQTEQVRLSTIEARKQQLMHFLALTRPGPPPWSEEVMQSLNAWADATVTFVPPDTPAPQVPPRQWSYVHDLNDSAGATVGTLHVVLHTPPAVRLLRAYQHTAFVLLLVALGLLVALVFILLIEGTRPSAEALSPDNDDGKRARGDFGSLSHLAKVSVQQGVDLERERNERLRAEEDSHFRQVLLNRALEERIQLGRELHDGIIQSLYATGLTLEAARNQLTSKPEAAAVQLADGLKALNATIREVRGYISGLAPERIQQQTFAEAVRSLTQTLVAGRDTTFDLRIDEAAAVQLTDAQATHLLQIAREGVSNALRHGHASQVTIRLHEHGGELCLLVQDNGRGFDPARTAGGGHGMGNIAARAQHINATLQVDSRPGKGTRIILTIPSAVAPAPLHA